MVRYTPGSTHRRGGVLVPVAARGQIALARALAKRPDILVCNQAIASLPATTRSDVFRRVRELLPATTIIWIKIKSTESRDITLE